MGQALIDGSPVELAAATAEAARLLGTSHLPVIAGLGCDIAGARAAISLARQLGAIIDHMHSGALMRDLDVAREAGLMVTTPNEARLRADTVLAVGPGPAAWPNLLSLLLAPPAAEEIGAGVKRRLFWLCPGPAVIPPGVAIRTLGRHVRDIPVLLAALRARVAGRPVSRAPVAARALDAVAADLKTARFGVAAWSAADLDALAIEMLCGLVDDLNAHTRFSGLPLRPEENAVGVMEACGWMTGLPLRTGFGRGHAEHDPWRFDAARLVDSGEADCAVWISAYGEAVPPWSREVPLIALTQPGIKFRRPASVQIDVGHPGVDHDAVEHLAVTGTLAPFTAAKPSPVASVAHVIGQIAAELRSTPC